jgi:predicted ribosomally synthesized peptide with SipW-like signal peptide
MRRILFPLLVIGLAGGLFTLGSGAFFSDTETDTDNTITAGSLDLGANENGSTACTVAAYMPAADGNVDFDPSGSVDNCVSAVQNDGSLAGDLWVAIVITNNENGCVDPETDSSDPNCGNPGAGLGELGGQLTVIDCTEAVTGGGTEDGAPCTSTTTLNDLAFSCGKVVTGLAATAVYTIEFDLTDANVNNLSQTDSVNVTFNYELVQSGQTADCAP